MLIALVPVLVLIIGLLAWALSANAKISEAGRIMFFCGLLVACFVAARSTIHIP